MDNKIIARKKAIDESEAQEIVEKITEMVILTNRQDSE